MKGVIARGARRIGPPLLFFLLVAALWQVVVIAFRVPPFVLPGPWEVFLAVRENFAFLLRATLVTAGGAFCGFAASMAIGVGIAAVFSQSDLIRRSCYPYALFLQTVPIVAIAPLIILWFGVGFPAVVAVSFIISVFPVITNGTAGMTETDADLEALFRLNNATRLQRLFKLQLPNAAPYLVAGARIASGLSVIGAIVGEFFAGFGGAQFGLGYLVVLASGQLKTAYLFAAIFASTLLGLVIFWTTGAVGEAALLRWRKRSES